jgi:hypothetical protein
VLPVGSVACHVKSNAKLPDGQGKALVQMVFAASVTGKLQLLMQCAL